MKFVSFHHGKETVIRFYDYPYQMQVRFFIFLMVYILLDIKVVFISYNISSLITH